MVVKATFKGRNSLGYKHGKEYKLIVSDVKGVSVTRLDNTGYCPYDSLSSFLNNWDNIVNVSEKFKNSQGWA